jgi:hypothetical protein
MLWAAQFYRGWGSFRRARSMPGGVRFLGRGLRERLERSMCSSMERLLEQEASGAQLNCPLCNKTPASIFHSYTIILRGCTGELDHIIAKSI